MTIYVQFFWSIKMTGLHLKKRFITAYISTPVTITLSMFRYLQTRLQKQKDIKIALQHMQRVFCYLFNKTLTLALSQLFLHLSTNLQHQTNKDITFVAGCSVYRLNIKRHTIHNRYIKEDKTTTPHVQNLQNIITCII